MNLDEFTEQVVAYKNMPGHRTGGPLHIVLDDMNVEEYHIRWCLETWLPAHPCSEIQPGTPYAGHEGDCTEQTREIVEALLALEDDDERYEWVEDHWIHYRDESGRFRW